MKRFLFFLCLTTLPLPAGSGAPTKIRSGQIDFADGVAGDLDVAGQLSAVGRLTSGDSTHALTIAVSAIAFRPWIISSTEPEWFSDSSSYAAYPKDTGTLRTGILQVALAPGTRLYQVVAHGVFADSAAGHQLRAQVLKQNIAAPAGPVTLTSETVQDGGTAGPFSVALTPDYVVESGYCCLIRVRLKNETAQKLLFYGIELGLRETRY